MAILLLFSNCSKKGSSTPADTALKINVTDNFSLPAAGATINLYSSQAGWLNQTGLIRSATSDGSGSATITGLSPAVYYWRITKGCLTNENGTITSNALTANITNTVTVMLQNVGTLKLVNTSTDSYKVYVNGVLTINSMPGNMIQLLTNAPIGSYTIRVVQLSGYIGIPRDETFTGTLVCGGTLSTTFP